MIKQWTIVYFPVSELISWKKLIYIYLLHEFVFLFNMNNKKKLLFIDTNFWK